MACYRPLQAYRLASGKYVFSKPLTAFSILSKLPCGQCIGCRLESSRQWGVRMMHEAQYHERNCFITLTFDDEHLLKMTKYNSLDKKIFQDFMKRFRIGLSRIDFKSSIRFYHCGEYGERFKRPHYHSIIFGYDFPDKVLWKDDKEHPLYRSQFLEKLWPFGFSSVGTMTFSSAAYVSRYICTKVNGDRADRHYSIIDYKTGEFFGYRQPEYNTMSNRPGIGSQWIDEFLYDTYKDDSVVVKGISTKPPRYYDERLKVVDPCLYERVKNLRREKAKANADEFTEDKLIIAEKIRIASFSKLIRSLD